MSTAVMVFGDLRWMLPALAMCLVLTGIHGYLGIHVLRRKVIFVDLALAQIAALGSTFAHLLGYDAHDPGSSTTVYLFSLGFTLLGAAIFAFTRMRHERVPQEAFIGIVYAMASAIAILLMSKSPGESEQIKEMLVGNVLLVTWPAVWKTALLYAAIGAFHYAFRKPFFEISDNAETALERGRRVRLWDFAFYASFGVVITSSVAVAGVLLVFSFLVVPAVVAFMFVDRIGARIGVAWSVGVLCSTAGMLLSYHGDLPTGPSVVTCFAALLVLGALTYHVKSSKRWGLALGRTVAGTISILATFVLLLALARKPPEEHAHQEEFQALADALESPDENAQIEAVHHLGKTADPHAVGLLAKALERASSDRVAEHILDVLPEFGDAASEAHPMVLHFALSATADPFLKLEAGASLLRSRDARGFVILRSLIKDAPPDFVEVKLKDLLRETIGEDFGLGQDGNDDAERARARARFIEWFDARSDRIRWRPDRKRFE